MTHPHCQRFGLARSDRLDRVGDFDGESPIAPKIIIQVLMAQKIPIGPAKFSTNVASPRNWIPNSARPEGYSQIALHPFARIHPQDHHA
jgi:hypothetical protein